MKLRASLPPAMLAAILLVAVPATASAKDKTKWLCKPGLKNNPCHVDLTTTKLKADGSSTVEKAHNAKNPKVDCFYVYPTVSDQKTTNANLHIDPEERAVATYQAARFSQTCNVWAPMYKQVTLGGIMGASIPASAAKIAYKSALSGWREYLAKHNHGRGVILLGHSQGSFVLRQLISDEIDKRPAIRRRIISAIIPGGDVLVRKGKGIGGDFKHVPACRSSKQIGCVVGYSAFGDTRRRTACSRASRGRRRVSRCCARTPPRSAAAAAPSSRTGDAGLPRHARARRQDLHRAGARRPDALAPPARALHRKCSTAGGASFLKIAALDGAHVPTPTPDATWGYHLGDVNLPLGNLTGLVASQSKAYLRSVRSR